MSHSVYFGESNKPLFVLEMANNHMGSVEHGLRIVREMAEAVKDFRGEFNFGIKLQYRYIPSFIHPDFIERKDLKFVKRFSETALTWDQFKQLKEAFHEQGFLAVCTPWDEISVEKIVEHKFDIIKVPSCYLTDWPLLEAVGKTTLPLVISVAGEALADIDRVVAFYTHRKRDMAVMHCIGEYPTPPENFQLNQIDLLRQRYKQVPIGYSTHEGPEEMDAVKMAIAKGARIFEKHVGVPTDTITLNPYSANPEQVRRWLEAAHLAFSICGVTHQRYSFSERELNTLGDLRRGVFAKTDLPAGTVLKAKDFFLALPRVPGQLVANDLSKYTEFTLKGPVEAKKPVLLENCTQTEKRGYVEEIVENAQKLLKVSGIAVPGQLDLEISHHYGISEFKNFGSLIITVVNRSYCKRLILLVPGQTHPEQWHELKDETYHILHGELLVKLDGKLQTLKKNDILAIPCGVRHELFTETGVVIEEISSVYDPGDSYYTDKKITQNTNRKTLVSYWLE
jgi:sialic acid synthase SpsE/mannose-6-phosphate isomerase-like protein (cupin superfamily)